jgi:hypothetical protein
MIETMKEGLLRVAEAISREKGNFYLARTDLKELARVQPENEPSRNLFSLGVGSYSVVKIRGGYIASVGLSRERLVSLRDLCDELLGEPGAPS